MAAIKYSRQREAIKSFLLTRYDHPTADTIYMHLRQDFPNISLGTVYRNLSLLAELGEICKISTDGPDHFDARVAPHYHFICRRCHGVQDLELPSSFPIIEEAVKDFPGVIEGHSIQFYGLCENCRKEAGQ